jgi:hypothetical protein
LISGANLWYIRGLKGLSSGRTTGFLIDGI